MKDIKIEPIVIDNPKIDYQMGTLVDGRLSLYLGNSKSKSLQGKIGGDEEILDEDKAKLLAHFKKIGVEIQENDSSWEMTDIRIKGVESTVYTFNGHVKDQEDLAKLQREKRIFTKGLPPFNSSLEDPRFRHLMQCAGSVLSKVNGPTISLYIPEGTPASVEVDITARLWATIIARTVERQTGVTKQGESTSSGPSF